MGGIYCKHRTQCPYVHPDDEDKKNKNKEPKMYELGFEQQTDEEMQNALLMGQLNAKQSAQQYKAKQKKTTKMIALFGQEDDDEFESSDDSDLEHSNVQSTTAEIEIVH